MLILESDQVQFFRDIGGDQCLIGPIVAPADIIAPLAPLARGKADTLGNVVTFFEY